ncbi:ubiquitin-like-specific protease, partial [Trifolium medium]|nr:ubiquitin-like-specific protease [Trifolium medium]
MGDDIFSVGYPEHLHLENIKEVVDHDWLSASVITVYARYLYDKFIGPHGLTFKISFLSPHVSIPDVEGIEIAKIMMKTKVLKDDKIILAPYNLGIHWILFVINPDAEDIYFLDPLGSEPSDHGGLKRKFE